MKNDKVKLSINLTLDEKKEIEMLSKSVNLTMTDFILNSVNDKKITINQIQKIDESITDFNSFLLENLTKKLESLKEDTLEIKSQKSFITISINKEDIKKGDIIIFKNNFLEVIKNSVEEKEFYLINLFNDKKNLIKYESLTDEIIVKRRA